MPKQTKQIVYTFPDMTGRRVKYSRLSLAEVKRIIRSKGKPGRTERGKEVNIIRAVPIGYYPSDIKGGAGLDIWSWNTGRYSKQRITENFKQMFRDLNYGFEGYSDALAKQRHKEYFELYQFLITRR